MKERAQYIVSYDISSNKVRRKIEKILKDAGLRRVQYSVFNGVVAADRIKFLAERFKNLERILTHSILVFIIKNGAMEVVEF